MHSIVFSEDSVKSLIAVASTIKRCFVRITDGKCLPHSHFDGENFSLPNCKNVESSKSLLVANILRGGEIYHLVMILDYGNIITKFISNSLNITNMKLYSLYEKLTDHSICDMHSLNALLEDITKSAPDCYLVQIGIYSLFCLIELIDVIIINQMYVMKRFSICEPQKYINFINPFYEDRALPYDFSHFISKIQIVYDKVVDLFESDDTNIIKLKGDKTFIVCLLHRIRMVIDNLSNSASLVTASSYYGYENLMWDRTDHFDTCHIGRALLTSESDIQDIRFVSMSVVTSLLITIVSSVEGVEERQNQMVTMKTYKCSDDKDIEEQRCTSVFNIGQCSGMPCYWDNGCKDIPSGYYSQQGQTSLSQCTNTINGPEGIMMFQRNINNLLGPPSGICDVFCNSFTYVLDTQTRTCIEVPVGYWAPKCSTTTELQHCENTADQIFLTTGYGNYSSCIRSSFFSVTTDALPYSVLYSDPPYIISINFTYETSSSSVRFQVLGIINIFFIQVNIDFVNIEDNSER